MSSKEDGSKTKDGTVTINIDDFTRTRDSVSFFPFLLLVIPLLGRSSLAASRLAGSR